MNTKVVIACAAVISALALAPAAYATPTTTPVMPTMPSVPCQGPGGFGGPPGTNDYGAPQTGCPQTNGS